MLLSQAGTAGIILRWLLARHRLPEFRLAVEIGAEMRQEDDEVRVEKGRYEDWVVKEGRVDVLLCSDPEPEAGW